MDEEEMATARADAREALVLVVQACEANWRLDDRLDLLWQERRGI